MCQTNRSQYVIQTAKNARKKLNKLLQHNKKFSPKKNLTEADNQEELDEPFETKLKNILAQRIDMRSMTNIEESDKLMNQIKDRYSIYNFYIQVSWCGMLLQQQPLAQRLLLIWGCGRSMPQQVEAISLPHARSNF